MTAPLRVTSCVFSLWPLLFSPVCLRGEREVNGTDPTRDKFPIALIRCRVRARLIKSNRAEIVGPVAELVVQPSVDSIRRLD